MIIHCSLILFNCSLATITSYARSVKALDFSTCRFKMCTWGSGESNIFMQSLECGVIGSTSVSMHQRPPTAVNDHFTLRGHRLE